MRRLASLSFGLVALAACARAGVRGDDARVLAITNVHVVDVESGVVAADQSLLIAGDRIRAVGAAATMRLPRGARVVDGGGGYLVPGLWDLHVHLTMAGRTALPILVANGVTGVRDMGGDFAQVRAWRDSIEAGRLLGPRVVVVGAVVENARWRNAVVGLLRGIGDSASASDVERRAGVASDDDARRVVDSVAALGATLLKVRNAPPRGAYFALLRHAAARGLQVVGHPPGRDVTLSEASDSGQRSIEHLLYAFGSDGVQRSALDAMTRSERESLYVRLVRNRTALVPTLVADVGMRRTADSTVLALIDDTAGVRDARRRTISPALARAWRGQIGMKRLEGAQPDWNALARAASARLRELDSAGVAVLTGTDLGTPLTYPGFAVHDELVLQVREGGRSAVRALWGATQGAATLLGLEGDLGTIRAGKRADLVLLEGDPTRDIENVRRVRAVVRDGRLLDRAALDALLQPRDTRR